jgi:ATP-binding cassette subfamily B protein
VLDEPTSSLDAKIENEILSRFREVGRKKISFVVSHRLSTARLADRIAVFDSGEVVECGTHAQLMAANGVYAELSWLQQRGYVE